MPSIRVLHPNIANQIAAGEVVERPASVVKELVENSLDAGASAVTVEIENGGISYIRVTDNGSGIPACDCALAFLRHATSKISSREDLLCIETLGFRGEALASIAAVSRVELKTRQKDGEGMRVLIEGGEKKLVQPAACTNGTTIVVESLFFNVPARKKFLKSTRSETGLISDYVARMILSRPDVAFRYINQKNAVYQSPGDNSLQNAIFCIYGSEVIQNLLKVDYDDGYIKISGYIGNNEIACPNRNRQSFFLNNRFIHSRDISDALMLAYDTQLMSKKYPFAVLALNISSREVDINVHPAKLEARFAQHDRVMQSILRACKEALGQKHIVSAKIEALLSDAGSPAEYENKAPDMREHEKPAEAERVFDTYDDQMSAPNDFFPLDEDCSYSIKVKENEYIIPQYQIEPVQAAKEPDSPVIREPMLQESFSGDQLNIIGRVFETYWIAQYESSIYFIDHHAAHERILYDKFMSEEQSNPSQALFAPEIIKLTGEEYGLFLQHTEDLCSIGFEIEDFGEHTIRVYSIPLALSGASIAYTLRDALQSIKKLGNASTKELRKEAIIQSACKHAVKAGDYLPKEAIIEMTEYFMKGDTPLTCPHGRPIMVKMERKQLEKMFKRLI